jgi:hypothetical protein
LVLVLGQAVLAKSRTPRVVLLGSGDRISTLIIAGNTRMLIASGTDGTAFLNAFSEALPFADRRVDLLVLAGDRDDLPVASTARRAIEATKVLVLDGGPSTNLDDLDLDSSSIVGGRKRITLTPTIAVTLVVSQSGWQAVIERGQTRIGVVSDPRQLEESRATRAFSALVVASAPKSELIPGSYLSLALPSKSPAPAVLVPEQLGAIPVLSVDNGRAAVLVFTPKGLRLPSSARAMLRPAAQTGTPPRAAIAAWNSARIAWRNDGSVSTS